MSSTLISNPVTTSDRSRESSRRKKKKRSQISRENQSQNPNTDQITWKSETQQQLYSSKLLQALRQVRLDSSSSAPRRGKAVREAADRVLAATAKGKTRWSRAILTNRLKIKFIKNSRRRRVAVSGAGRLPKKPKVSILKLKSKNLPAVQRKARFLGRLVPGCRKQPLPVVLEEASDYIAALEMQVRAMASLADLLSGGSGSSSGSAMALDQNRPSPSC
nr:bHLH16 [Bupleurum chinense]